MNTYSRWTILVAAIFLTACPKKPPVLVPPAFDGEACASWRWIGIQRAPDPTCPAVPGWSERSLFSPFLGDDDLPAGLRPFCLYEHPGRPDEEAIRKLVETPELARVEPDCATVTPAASLREVAWRPLQEQFFSQTGQVALPTAGPFSVRLAFLDSQPTGRGLSDPPGTSSHGYTLGHMARHLACRGGTCTPSDISITQRLALSISSFDPDDAAATQRDPNGGFIGTIGELAQAIRDEVVAWQDSPAPAEHLVLNLSLGWDGQLFGGLQDDPLTCTWENLEASSMKVAPQAVLCALQDAACRGALTVAAAGNRTACSGSGPILPAAWEATMYAPGRETCQRLLALDTPDGPFEGGGKADREEPLLYAAGGVQATGSPLSNARPQGEPIRVAYGDHAVVEGHQADLPTAMYTGTSVSAAVVSATAAVVWNLDGGLTRNELMRRLYSRGERLGRTADFSPPTESGEVRRISLCRALGERCPTGFGSRPAISRILRRELSEAPAAEARRIGTRGAESEEIEASERSARRCEPAGKPWTHPQPETLPCSGCALDPPPESGQSSQEELAAVSSTTDSCTLHVAIDPTWKKKVTTWRLTIGSVVYGLPGLTLGAGDAGQIRVPDCQVGDPIVLTFRSPQGAIENPVLWVKASTEL